VNSYSTCSIALESGTWSPTKNLDAKVDSGVVSVACVLKSVLEIACCKKSDIIHSSPQMQKHFYVFFILNVLNVFLSFQRFSKIKIAT